MEELYNFLMQIAKDEGAETPMLGDASGEPCIVDIDSGKVWKIELREI